jgi:hypothetical protein
MNLNLISKPLSLILYIITLMPKACTQSNFHTMIRQKEKRQTLSKKAKRGGEKTLTENNKKEGIEDQGSGTWIASLAFLFYSCFFGSWDFISSLPQLAWD